MICTKCYEKKPITEFRKLMHPVRSKVCTECEEKKKKVGG